MTEVPYDSGFEMRRLVAPRRVVVIDDHRMLVQMLVRALEDRGFIPFALDVDDDPLADRIVEMEPDLVLLDGVFGDDEQGGMNVLRSLRSMGWADRVVILTGVVDEVRHAQFLAEGARGVLLKSDSFDGVIEKVASVLEGIDPMGVNRRQQLADRLRQQDEAAAAKESVLAGLTDREMATLQALVDGHTVDEIALRRTVATSTVRSQVRAVLSKLDAHSQIEAVAIAARAGMRPAADVASWSGDQYGA